MNYLKTIIYGYTRKSPFFVRDDIIRIRCYNVSRYIYTTKINDCEHKDSKSKTKVAKVTLISDADKVELLSLPEAQKIALRRNLKLVKTIDFDSKTQRPVYKLMSGSEYFALESKQRGADKKNKDRFKGEKLLSISGRIETHDIASKIKLITKWISKNYEVRVIISKDGCDPKKIDNIINEIVRSSDGTANVMQKRASHSDIRFTLVPSTMQKVIESEN